jgi:hypothetical protein
MDVNLCPSTNHLQASCSINADDADDKDNTIIFAEHQAIVSLNQPVSTVVYLDDHGEVDCETNLDKGTVLLYIEQVS